MFAMTPYRVHAVRLVAPLILASLSAFAVADGGPVAGEAEDVTLVTWKNLELTRGDFFADLRRLAEENREEFRRDAKRIGSALENLLVYRTLAAEGRAMGLDRDPMLRREIELASDRIIGLERLRRYREAIQVPDMQRAAREVYLGNPSRFSVPERIRAAHVLIKTGARTEAEARLRAEEVRAKAIAGADFGALAVEFSDESTAAANQGDLGFFGRGAMVPPFEAAAFALKGPGDISEVVKSRFGFHVIRLTERLPARTKPFEEVKDVILRELSDAYVNERIQEFLSGIRKDPSIKMNTEAIDALQLRLRDAMPPG